jgi:hypothetical protein
MFLKFSFLLISSEDEDKDENSFQESALSQLVRERVIKGDVNTEIPTLPKMVKIVVASIHEGK